MPCVSAAASLVPSSKSTHQHSIRVPQAGTVHPQYQAAAVRGVVTVGQKSFESSIRINRLKLQPPATLQQPVLSRDHGFSRPVCEVHVSVVVEQEYAAIEFVERCERGDPSNRSVCQLLHVRLAT